MKKIIISVLLIAIPAISNAARDDVVVPDLPVNPDLPLDPCLDTCLDGWEMDLTTCTCVQSCDTDALQADCEDMNAESKWTVYDMNKGILTKTAYVVDESTCSCSVRTHLACMDGYFGTPKNWVQTSLPENEITCTPCPLGGTSDGEEPGSAKINGFNSSITGCYLPANTTYTDPAGTYTYTDECYYK